MRTRRLLLLTVLLVVVSLTGFVPAWAQQAGDTLRVVLPAGTPIVQGPTGDVLVYIMQPAGFMEMLGCAADTIPRPVQTVLVLDPGADRTGRPFQITVVTISDNGAAQTAPVRNGTRVGNLTFVGTASPSCAMLNGAFDKYDGTVK